MDPLLGAFVLVVIVLVTAGVWGWTVLSELMKSRTAKLQGTSADPRVDELLEDHRRLEARLGQLEEEVAFFRQLHAPDQSSRLPPGGGEGGA